MVKKLWKTQLWLNGREGKVASLEGVIRKMVQIRERDGSGDEDRSILHHVQELQRITETLEGEVGTEDFDDFDYENDGFIGSSAVWAGLMMVLTGLAAGRANMS